MDEYHRSGGVQRLDEQRIAGRSPERRWARMTEAMIDPDSDRPGLMDGSDELCEHGPVEHAAESRFVFRITDDNRQGVAHGNRGPKANPAVVQGPVQGTRGDRRRCPKPLREQTGQQSDREGLEQRSRDEEPPCFGWAERHHRRSPVPNSASRAFASCLGNPLSIAFALGRSGWRPIPFA